jgi:hypothetical protein
MTDTMIAFSDALGRRVRMGSWQDQRISTYRKIHEAIDEGRWDDAAQLANYFVEEASVCYGIYRQWIPDLNRFMADNGVPKEEIDAANERIVALLALPDGTPWNHLKQWHLVHEHCEQLVAHIYREEADEAHAALDRLKETWRRCHDRDVDHTYGLMSELVARLGEAALGRMWERVLLPLFAWRYEKFDIDKYPWDEGLEVLMTVACEAMRGHLSGPEREGDFELIETDDRYILRFDPCGSGGRIPRGDVIEGTPPRTEPPYNWSVSAEPHTWNHGQIGVCHYCTHCIYLMEEIPIDRFGYPVRVVDPPVLGGTEPDGSPQKCQWQMFKDPTAVPEEYYERVGRTKPTEFGSSKHAADDLPDITVAMPGAG